MRAMDDAVKLVDASPPGAIGFGFPETRRSSFRTGRLQPRLGRYRDPRLRQEAVADQGQVGSTPTPGVDGQVYDRKTKAWKDVPKGTPAPYLAFGGWLLGVPKTAKNKEAAWDLAVFLADPVRTRCSWRCRLRHPARRISTTQNTDYLVKAGRTGGHQGVARRAQRDPRR